MILRGLLVDLVPYGKAFMERDHDWWNNESRFWGSMGDRRFVSQAAVDRDHAEWLSDEDDGDMGVPFGIQTKSGKPLGYVGINWMVPAHRWANLGAVISEPAYWGGGYGTDAVLLLLDYAFDVLDLRRCWLVTMAPNERVLRQMDKVGFTLEGRPRDSTWVNGQWVDAVLYGMLREEWPGRAAMVEKLGLQPRPDPED